MKKILAFAFALILAFPLAALTGCTDRASQLKMYIPGEYIDEEILGEFEEWYKQETGKTVEVVAPTTFDAVEEILTAVERDHADYDLLLPSDYAVEQLIAKGLVQKVDRSLVKVEELIKPEYVERAKISDPTLEYSVPYMYGTFGIMYDYSKTGRHIDSWSSIFTDEFNKKSANKDSLREAVTSATIWYNRDELSALSSGFTDYNEAYTAKLQSLYEDFSAASIDNAIGVLNEMKNYSAIWGGESLKFDMASGSTNVQVALMWSCDAGYVMNDYEDDNGEEHSGNRNMWYVVPKEGGNIYLDSFVISKYAKNAEAANYFLKFLCLKETALKNSEYAGAISPVAAAYDELYEQYTSDTSYAEESGQAWRDMYIDTLFPSPETLARCGTMRDFKDADAEISVKWANVRNQ